MTEFLKNNPIALRHCLLYQFLQENSVETAFVIFCETVGPDVITKEEFQFWFDQFEQGKFDDKEQPLADMKEVLRNDKQALRACVMYECLSSLESTLTVFAKYENFCKVVGKYAMKFRDFDFWFHRFVGGEYDLNFERDKNKKIYELMEMPIDVMKNIVEYLDIFDRLALKKTSQSLQAFIEDQKQFHPILTLVTHTQGSSISFEDPTKPIIKYTKNGNDCVKLFKTKEKLIKDVFNWEQALTDFKQVLEIPKLHLDRLMLFINMPVYADLVFDILEDALKSTHLLHVKKITLQTSELEPLLKILPNLKPGYLTTIDISSLKANGDEIRMLAELEQWKHAECLMMNASFYTGSLYDLFCFRRFTINFRKISDEDIQQMKEILFKSPGFEKCRISLVDHLDTDTIRQEFGDFIPGMPNIYHYPIPNSTEYFEVVLRECRIEVARKKK